VRTLPDASHLYCTKYIDSYALPSLVYIY